MKIRLDCLVLFLMLSLCPAGWGAAPNQGVPPLVPIPSAEELLASLRPEHPRLLLTARGLLGLRERVEAEPLLRRWRTDLEEQAARIVRQRPSEYEIPDGKRLLNVSRRVLGRTYTLALLCRLNGQRTYLERLWQELEAAAAFKDWNPSHFLDTAEMTHAFAVGYDWLYQDWSEAQRATLRAAMVEKGLKPALNIYEQDGWWARARHNWNQVCNGGIGMGALALAEVEPALAGRILHAGLESIQLAMAEYGPDGAWAEGPGYWNYATSYNVVILAALQTALGTDFNLSSIPGFAECGLFPIHATGPSGRTFNYADGGDGAIRSPSLFWLARKFDRPAYAAYQRRVASPHPLDLVWGTPFAGSSPQAELALDKYFREAEVVCFRGSWEDANAWFAAFKAGDNKANHSHLDLGTFVLDALGHRWAVDLGADDYNLPGYFGRERWTYYRLRAEGHNTLVLNPSADPDQDPRAAGKILKFESNPVRAYAVADLTRAYARHAERVQRGVRREGATVLVQDEIEAGQPAEVWWFMHTPAQVSLSDDQHSAILTQGQAKLWASLLSPSGARFTVLEAKPLPSSPNPENQRANERVRKLAVHLPGMKNLRLVVAFAPAEGESPGPAAQATPCPPLAEW